MYMDLNVFVNGGMGVRVCSVLKVGIQGASNESVNFVSSLFTKSINVDRNVFFPCTLQMSLNNSKFYPITSKISNFNTQGKEMFQAAYCSMLKIRI